MASAVASIESISHCINNEQWISFHQNSENRIFCLRVSPTFMIDVTGFKYLENATDHLKTPTKKFNAIDLELQVLTFVTFQTWALCHVHFIVDFYSPYFSKPRITPRVWTAPFQISKIRWLQVRLSLTESAQHVASSRNHYTIIIMGRIGRKELEFEQSCRDLYLELNGRTVRTKKSPTHGTTNGESEKTPVSLIVRLEWNEIYCCHIS